MRQTIPVEVSWCSYISAGKLWDAPWNGPVYWNSADSKVTGY